MAFQSLEILHVFILRHPCWWAKQCPPAIFPYNIIENPGTYLARNSDFIDLNNFKFGTETLVWSFKPHQNLGQIDPNLHNKVFDDVICKPPILK